METLAAIDIGSNAIRLVIGEIDHYGDIRILKKIREPVRLGADVFSLGCLSPKTREKALATFVKFRDILGSYGVQHYRAVATSALREARDRDEFVSQTLAATGIRLDIIDGIEEGKLIFSAVNHRVDLHDKTALLIDIGGGSVELTLVDDAECIATQTFKLGTVRLLESLNARGLKEKHLPQLLDEALGPARVFLNELKQTYRVELAVGTGGNFECLGKLRVALLHKTSIFSMTRKELGDLAEHLLTMSLKERIQFLRLRPDRADVVVPAALVTKAVMEIAETELLTIPYVGLRDGILAELGSRIEHAHRK
jgi:exopolyphosphatase/guanosine-5'-triphosphate,3'-diphosphate pyrophosphatase